jgi:hypothetical protein
MSDFRGFAELVVQVLLMQFVRPRKKEALSASAEINQA